jgi:hypothetical protein
MEQANSRTDSGDRGEKNPLVPPKMSSFKTQNQINMPQKETQARVNALEAKSDNSAQNTPAPAANSVNKDELLVLELMAKNKVDATNIISLGNYGYRYLVLNWIISLKRAGYDKFLVFCFDKSIVNFLTEQGYKDNAVLIPRNWLDYNISEEASEWTKKEYNYMAQSKVNVLYNLLTRKYSLLYSDPDTVWLSRHIIPHINFNLCHSFAEILFSQDQINNVLHFNTGFFYAKPTEFVISLFKKLIESQQTNPNGAIDQLYLHDMLMKTRFNDSRIEALDSLLYPSGQVYFNLNLNANMEIKPMIIHANYRVGKKSKINTLKRGKFWYVNSTSDES